LLPWRRRRAKAGAFAYTPEILLLFGEKRFKRVCFDSFILKQASLKIARSAEREFLVKFSRALGVPSLYI
jgi:hypothetical protein